MAAVTKRLSRWLIKVFALIRAAFRSSLLAAWKI